MALLWDHGSLDDSDLHNLADHVANSRCVYAVCGGARAQLLEELLDESHVLRTVGGIDDAELMITTAHAGESPAEVAAFFFGCAFRPDGEFRRLLAHFGGTKRQRDEVAAAVDRKQQEYAP